MNEDINKIDENNNPITFYSLFNPKTGVKLKVDICKNDTILVSKIILSYLFLLLREKKDI